VEVSNVMCFTSWSKR